MEPYQIGGTDMQGTEALLERVADFYHRILLRGNATPQNLVQWGLDDMHLVESYRIGHCDGSLMNLLATGDIKRQLFLRLGLAAEKGGKVVERLLDHVVVPLTDADGGVAALWGIHGSGSTNLIPHHIPPFWNTRTARLYPEILLCDNILDGLSLVRAGFPNVIALSGSKLILKDIAELESLGVQKIIALATNDSILQLRPLCSQITFSGVEIPRNKSLNASLVREGSEELSNTVRALIKAAPIEHATPRLPVQIDTRAGKGLNVTFGLRAYTLCGIERTPRRLRATVRTQFRGKLHVDTLDFYNARCRKTLAQDLCRLFEEAASVIETDIGRLITLCENHDPQQAVSETNTPVSLTPEEQAEAEAFGKQPDLLNQIARDYDEYGFIGEYSNKLISYLAAVSRKLDDPLSILTQSSSGAGKTALQDATLSLCPPEDVVKITSLSSKALFYKGKTSLKHKILAIEEGAGAEDASYAIRNLVSAKELVIESAVKDMATGRITTMENRVEGPTSVFITTTDPDIDAETRSRFIMLAVDESREQTRVILAFQRRRQTLEAVTTREAVEAIQRRHRNFQRLLKPVMVVNPHAVELTYFNDRLQSRRDHPKYLNLIRTVAFLHQMGREVKAIAGMNGEPISYIEVTPDDIEVAGRLLNKALEGNNDNISGTSRALLDQIERMNAERTGSRPGDNLFTRREIREYTGWAHHLVKRGLQQLVELEHVAVVTGRIGTTFRYKLLPRLSAPALPKPGQPSPTNSE